MCVQVTALVKLKECEDTHLGEEVDRNWAEVATQQYVFNRLHREVRHTQDNSVFLVCAEFYIACCSFCRRFMCDCV